MTLRIFSCVCLIMATGCASVPPVLHPTLEITLPEEWTTENSRTGAVEVTWWEDFDDGGLSSAIDVALSQNYDLRAATARLEQAAAAAEATTLGGLHMLVYQGVLSFQMWTGRDAPVAIMLEAATRAMAAR